MIQIGNYKLGELLGKGAFGETYEATKGNEKFALKLIKEEAVLKGFDVNRFKRECRSLEKVQHKNIVKIIEYGQEQVGRSLRYFLVMEYLAGQDLEKYFQGKSFSFDERNLKDILIQVLTGLNAMHAKNILHRDIKPQNIFITDGGIIKLLDFGLVKMIDYTTLTMTGEGFKGTPLYIPPEAIRDEKLDYRSDLYSLGVMIFYIVTKGHFPFEASNIMHLTNMVLNEPPSTPRTYNKKISNEFENLILMLLSKQPFERNITHEELTEEIKKTPILLDSEIRTVRRKTIQKKVLFRLLPNEKSKIMEFLENSGNLEGIEYVANYLPRNKKTLQELEDKNINYFFDPATNRLPYSTFSQTKGLVDLPYCWDDYNRLTTNDLRDLNSIKKYVKQVIEWQAKWKVDFFVAPFHFHKNLGDPWLEVDLKLLNEAIAYVREKHTNKQIFSGICLNIEEYTAKTNRLALLNEFSLCKPDGFIFYGDEINEATSNPARLYAYVELVRLFSKLGKTVIGARLGTLGLGVLAAGADVVTTGIASLTGFSETNLLQERSTGYNMTIKYYIPDLMLSLPELLAKDLIKADRRLACGCNFCSSASTLGASAKTHYMQIRQNEVKELNSIGNKDKIKWFLERTQRAFDRCKELHKKVIELRPSYFAHFNTWLNVFESYK